MVDFGPNLHLWNSRPAPRRHLMLWAGRELRSAYFGSDRPIFHKHQHEFGPNAANFDREPHRCPELHGLRPRGRQLWFAAVDFSLETGPKLTFGTHDRPSTDEFASHTTFQKQQKCNSPVIAGFLLFRPRQPVNFRVPGSPILG